MIPWADEALIRVIGPWAPGLVERLAAVRNDFDAFVFYTFQFYPTSVGIHMVGDRAVLVPTAHDVPEFYRAPVARTRKSARRIIALTPEEETLIRKRVSGTPLDIRIAACGIEAPDPAKIAAAPELASGPYLLTLGRRKPRVQDVPDLLRAFRERYGDKTYIDDNARPFRGAHLRWVLAGDASYSRFRGDGVEIHGPIAEDAKWRLLSGALALVNPSLYESLSLTLLESWAVGRPTLANALCAPMVGQTTRSRAGAVYTTPRAFADALDGILKDAEERRATGARGQAFVREHYTWDHVLGQYWGAIEPADHGQLASSIA